MAGCSSWRRAWLLKVLAKSLVPHTAYLFANRRTNRMKALVQDGIGFRLAARRPHLGHFVRPTPDAKTQVHLSHPQPDELVLGLR